MRDSERRRETQRQRKRKNFKLILKILFILFQSEKLFSKTFKTCLVKFISKIIEFSFSRSSNVFPRKMQVITQIPPSKNVPTGTKAALASTGDEQWPKPLNLSSNSAFKPIVKK